MLALTLVLNCLVNPDPSWRFYLPRRHHNNWEFHHEGNLAVNDNLQQPRGSSKGLDRGAGAKAYTVIRLHGPLGSEDHKGARRSYLGTEVCRFTILYLLSRGKR